MGSDRLLDVRGLGRTYPRRDWLGREKPGAVALRDAAFTLGRGETMAVAGPSGSGKSTLARCLAGWDRPTSGEIRIEGRAPLAGEVQLIPQQPAESLNPRFTALEIVAEPLVIGRVGTARTRAARALELMDAVGLAAESAGRRAHESSGGQRQRLAVARALALEPKVLILDESLSGLDLSLRAAVARLLLDLQKTLGLAYLLISHDLDLAARLAGWIAVMEDGAIVEQGPARDILERPGHRLTRELVAAGGCG